MAKLTAPARAKIPTKSFAGPDRSYPIEDRSHARNALARVSQHGNSALKAQVRAKVARKYPGMGDRHEGGHQAGHAGRMEKLRGHAKTSAERSHEHRHGKDGRY
jgi:hypothetical protein